MPAHGVRGVWLAVGDKHAARRPVEPAQPVQDLGVVGVTREVVDHCHRGTHRDVGAMDLDRLGAGDQRRPARATGLVADEQHRIARIRRERLQVMHYPAAGGHAAAGNQDHRATALVEPPRFVGAVDDLRRAAHGVTLRRGEAVLATVVMEDGQRTIGLGTAAGAFAEYVAVAAHECVRLPAGLDSAQGALIEPLAVALHAVRVGRLRATDHVLVLGAGPIGLGAVLWARHFGAREIFVCERAPERRRLAETLGASVTAAPEELERALALALPARPSLVVEAVGAPGLIQRALDCVRFRGRVVVTGVCLGADAIQPLPALTKEASVQFALAYEKDDFQYAVDALESGRIDPLPMATDRRALAGIPAAFEALAAPGDQCKVLYV